jgi:hypothetical protein
MGKKVLPILSVLISMILILIPVKVNGAQAGKIVKVQKYWITKKEFKVPESVLYYEKWNTIFVSNINGSPAAKDGNGFISKLGLDGKIIKLKWVTGLNGPKGMGIFKGKLYVADIDRVVEIDIDNAEIVKEYRSSSAKFLNDITIDSAGNVFVSDNVANLIFSLRQDKLDIWLKSGMLDQPNGLYAEKGHLLIGIDNAVLSVDYKSKKINRFIENTDYIDGLVPMNDGKYLISDFMGSVHVVQPGKEKVKILDTTVDDINAADIDFIINKKLLLVPTFGDNGVMAYKVR